MDIQSGYYEAGIVLFWLLFAYLFMDKFLFRGELGEICFGKMRRRMAKGLRSIAGWFDPAKEEPKKGRRRTKGKTEKKEVPAVAVPEAEERNHPTVKVEMKGKEKEEAKKEEKPKGIATFDEITFEDFSKIELRVGKILDCEPVKKSKKLLKLTVNDGEKERTVVSGISQWYQPDDLIGHHIILVANLKPAKLCGVESQGMILAADCDENTVKVIFVDDMPAGSGIH